jgi:hypothetical protein
VTDRARDVARPRQRPDRCSGTCRSARPWARLVMQPARLGLDGRAWTEAHRVYADAAEVVLKKEWQDAHELEVVEAFGRETQRPERVPHRPKGNAASSRPSPERLTPAVPQWCGRGCAEALEIVPELVRAARAPDGAVGTVDLS